MFLLLLISSWFLSLTQQTLPGVITHNVTVGCAGQDSLYASCRTGQVIYEHGHHIGHSPGYKTNPSTCPADPSDCTASLSISCRPSFLIQRFCTIGVDAPLRTRKLPCDGLQPNYLSLDFSCIQVSTLKNLSMEVCSPEVKTGKQIHLVSDGYPTQKDFASLEATNCTCNISHSSTESVVFKLTVRVLVLKSLKPDQVDMVDVFHSNKTKILNEHTSLSSEEVGHDDVYDDIRHGVLHQGEALYVSSRRTSGKEMSFWIEISGDTELVSNCGLSSFTLYDPPGGAGTHEVQSIPTATGTDDNNPKTVRNALPSLLGTSLVILFFLLILGFVIFKGVQRYTGNNQSANRALPEVPPQDGTPEHLYDEPEYLQRGTAGHQHIGNGQSETGLSEPRNQSLGYSDPGYSDPGYSDLGYSEPEYTEPQNPGIIRLADPHDNPYSNSGTTEHPGNNEDHYNYAENYDYADTDVENPRLGPPSGASHDQYEGLGQRAASRIHTYSPLGQ